MLRALLRGRRLTYVLVVAVLVLAVGGGYSLAANSSAGTNHRGPNASHPGIATWTAMATRMTWSQPTLTPGSRKVLWGKIGAMVRVAGP